MSVDDSLDSIRRWLLAITLLLTIQVYYLASDNYTAPGSDLVVVFSVVLGIVVVLFLIDSLLGARRTDRPSELDSE